jgi:hypothetical protein
MIPYPMGAIVMRLIPIMRISVRIVSVPWMVVVAVPWVIPMSIEIPVIIPRPIPWIIPTKTKSKAPSAVSPIPSDAPIGIIV